MEQHQFNFTRQLKGLLRLKWMIILVTLVAGVTALMATGQQPLTYTATVTMLIERNPNLGALPAGADPYAQDIVSQIEVIKTHDVLERAITQIEPDMANNPDQLELAIMQLRDNLTVRQYSGTSLVGIDVVSTDPLVAQQQAQAIADAYIVQVQTTTQAAIETVLENTTKRMHDLITREVDFSNNPQLTRLSAQFNTAVPALQSAQDQLQQMAKGTGAPAVGDPGTVLTTFQLNMIAQQMTDISDEATQLTSLAGQLNPLSKERDFGVRAANISVIESNMRALATKLTGLSSEVSAMAGAEIDPQVQEQLNSIVEQIRIASVTGGAFLDQVISLYGAQNQYRQAYSAVEPDSTQIALYAEQDRNSLRRINEHGDLMASSLATASSQTQKISPRAGTLTQWRLQVLGKRTASVISMLQNISQRLQPTLPDNSVMMNQPDIASLEVQGQMVSLTMATLVSELQSAQTQGVSPEVTASLIGVQDVVNEANVAVGNLGTDITNLAEQESSSLSYTALDQLRQNLQYSLLEMEGTATSRVVDSAVMADAADIFTKYKGTILAVIAGLFIACLIALILNYFDRTARDAAQASDLIGLPPLAQVARVKVTNNSGGPFSVLAQAARVKATNNPGGPLSVLTERMYQCLEAFRLLRTNLAIDAKRGQALLITSASEKEGKTTIAANLARVVALQGRRVLLIDANLRKPSLAEAFDLEPAEGLSDYLKGKEEPWDYITQADGVDIIPSGTASITSAEMLSSPRMKTLLENAKEMFDVVILDSAPVMGCADTRILAREVDGVVMVVKKDASNLDLVRSSVSALETMGAHLAGFVLNKAALRDCKYLPPPHIADRHPEDLDVDVAANIS
jgi:capsular exopolysaccharide synthesis family protein